MKKFSLPKDGGLIETGLPNGIKHTYERIPAHIFEDEVKASNRIAEKIIEAINTTSGTYRLGLSTGSHDKHIETCSLSVIFCTEFRHI